MSSSDRHADHEAISGFVDGEAPEWADHIAACAACQASVAELRAVAAAVGGPVDRPPTATREAAIVAALEAFPAPAAMRPTPDRLAAQRERVARRRMSLPSWAMPAVAAVVVGLLGVSGFIVASGNRSTDETTTFAVPALESDAKAGGSSGLAAATPAIPATDLGEVPDAATLLARSRAPGLPGAAASETGAARSSSNSAAASDSAVTGAPTATSGSSGAGATAGASGGTSAAISPPTTTLSQRAVAPGVVGTRPCEQEARAREPGLGQVGVFATARRSGVEAYVLGFTAPGGASPVTLLMLAQDGCRELLRAAGP